MKEQIALGNPPLCHFRACRGDDERVEYRCPPPLRDCLGDAVGRRWGMGPDHEKITRYPMHREKCRLGRTEGVGQGDRIWPQHPNPVWATGKIERKSRKCDFPGPAGRISTCVRPPVSQVPTAGVAAMTGMGHQLGTMAGGGSPIRQPSARRTVDSRKSRQSMCQVAGRLSRSCWKVSSRCARTW